MKKVWFAVIALFLLIPACALAVDYRAAGEDGNQSISAKDFAKNVYAFGASVSSAGNIQGDYTGAGAAVSLKGRVDQSAFLAGNNVTVDSTIGQSLRVAAANAQISGKIGEDLLAAAGTFILADNSTVSGDLALASGMASIDGDVAGRVWITGGNVTLNSSIGGDVIIKDVEQLTLGDNVVVEGSLKYSSQNEAKVSSAAQVRGGIEYTPVKSTHNRWQAFATIGTLLSFLSALILVLILIYLLPKFSRFIVHGAYPKWGSAFGIGLLFLIVVPIVVILLLISVLGLQTGGLLGFSYAFLLMLAKPIGALLLGTGVLKLFDRKATEYRVDWLSGLVGAVLATVLMLIPYVGWIIPFVFYAMALGVLGKWSWNWITRNR